MVQEAASNGAEGSDLVVKATGGAGTGTGGASGTSLRAGQRKSGSRTWSLPGSISEMQAAVERSRGPSRLRESRVPGDTVVDVVVRIVRMHSSAMHIATEELAVPLPVSLGSVARVRPSHSVAGYLGAAALAEEARVEATSIHSGRPNDSVRLLGMLAAAPGRLFAVAETFAEGSH